MVVPEYQDTVMYGSHHCNRGSTMYIKSFFLFFPHFFVMLICFLHHHGYQIAMDRYPDLCIRFVVLDYDNDRRN